VIHRCLLKRFQYRQFGVSAEEIRGRKPGLLSAGSTNRRSEQEFRPSQSESGHSPFEPARSSAVKRFLWFGYVVAAGVVSFAGCSGGGGGGGGGSVPTPGEPPPVVVSTTFPSDLATAAGGGTAWAITGVKTTLYGQFHRASGNAYDTLRVDVTFAQNVANALPSPGASLSLPTQLGMTVAIDTGTAGHFATCSNNVAVTPFQYESDPGNEPSRLSDGNYSILNDAGPIYTGPANPGSEAQTAVSGNTISQVFFLETLGVEAGSLIPNVKIDVAAFNGTDPGVTDCVPSGNGEIAAGSS
jgi:hypothetical protein